MTDLAGSCVCWRGRAAYALPIEGVTTRIAHAAIAGTEP